MNNRIRLSLVGLMLQAITALWASAQSPGLVQLPYNHPGLVVDLGVGLWAWPIPCDADSDGDYDLIVSCPDKPSNGVWFFENRHSSPEAQHHFDKQYGLIIKP